jgi:hypothetical protein
MTAKEIYDWLEKLLTSPNRDAADYPLVIRTSEPHLSGQGIVPIKSLSIGFDWYKGKILVTPDKELVPKESHRDVAKKPFDAHIPEQYKAKIKPYFVCPECEEPLKNTFRYCPKCGQKLDWEK